jgi:hypothetical protein
MNKLHTLLLAFSAVTSAKIWADGPALQRSALQAPALTTSSEAKESPIRKLMELLAKAKQQKAPGPITPELQAAAPIQTISSAQDLVSLAKSQGLSFKDALEKMGVGVSKRFSKRLNGKKGQKLFLNKIKKEGLSWQDAAASLKLKGLAEIAPANKAVTQDPFSDFEAYLQNTFPTDNAGLLMSTLLDSWQSILRNSSDSVLLQDFASCFTDVENQILGSMNTACQTKYGTLLNQAQLDSLITFQKAMALKDAATLANICPVVANTIFDATKTNTDQLSKDLLSSLTHDFKTAYRIIEKSLSRDSFDNADTLSLENTLVAGKYTGLTNWGQLQAKALKVLETALDYKMDRQGLGRLIYGGTTIAALATCADKTAVKNNDDFKFACKKLDSTGNVVEDTFKVDKYSTLIDNILMKVPAIFTFTSKWDKARGTNINYVLADNRDYAVTAPKANQSLTLQLLAAAGDESIEDHNELTAAEKPAAYYIRQLLNGGAPSDTWLSRNDYTICGIAPGMDENDGPEGRRNRMEEGQENPSEEEGGRRGNNRNNVNWEN